MASKKGFICAAYACHNQVSVYKSIKDVRFGFCDTHRHLLDNGSTMTILEIIGSTKQDIMGLKSMVNFSNTGYTEAEFDNTVQYLFGLGEIEHSGSILITKESRHTCEFHGCKLKKRAGSCYCSNHKNLPSLEVVDGILSSVRCTPKTSKQISDEVKTKADRVKAALYQLIKFGYILKEKRGVTNYYLGR